MSLAAPTREALRGAVSMATRNDKQLGTVMRLAAKAHLGTVVSLAADSKKAV